MAARECLREDYSYVVAAVAPSASSAFLDESTQEEIERARATEWGGSLDRAARLLGGAEPVVLHGDPGHTILELAEEHGADVIVVGRHHPGAIRKALGASVSEHVLDNAKRAVLVLPLL